MCSVCKRERQKRSEREKGQIGYGRPEPQEKADHSGALTCNQRGGAYMRTKLVGGEKGWTMNIFRCAKFSFSFFAQIYIIFRTFKTCFACVVYQVRDVKGGSV